MTDGGFVGDKNIPAVSAKGFRGKTYGAFVLVGFIELAVYLTAVVDPQLLPGNWTPLVPAMTFYLFSTFFALFIVGRDSQLLGGSLDSFLIRFSIGAALTWGLLTVVAYAGSGGPAAVPLAGGAKLQTLMFTGFFIAPVEELLFRVAAPRYFGWLMGSSVLFALYHVPVVILENPHASWHSMVSNIAFLALMGVVLWFAYTLKRPVIRFRGVSYSLGGYGFSLGIHFLYDVFVYGAVLGLPLALVHLGIFPI